MSHYIKAGRAVCEAAPDAPCRVYPSCDCDSFLPELHGDNPKPGHEPVPQAECLYLLWINADGDALDASYSGDGYGEGYSDAAFPDGPITTTWEHEYLTWEYNDEDLRPRLPDDDEEPY